MRLWTLHPKHLDRQGLQTLWRDGLAVRAAATATATIDAYLHVVAGGRLVDVPRIVIPEGQLYFEAMHLAGQLRRRGTKVKRASQLLTPHPLFKIERGNYGTTVWHAA